MTNTTVEHPTDFESIYEQVARRGALLHVEHVAIHACDPSSVLETLAQQNQAVVWWRHQSQWMIASGCVEDCLVRGAARFEQAQFSLAGWRERLTDPKMSSWLHLVGGFAFSESTNKMTHSPWRAFGDLRLWLPQLCVVHDAQGTHAVLCYWLKPGETISQWQARGARLRERLSRWVERRAASCPPEMGRYDIAPMANEAQWSDLVDHTASVLGEDDQLQKVVLARGLRMTTNTPWSVGHMVRALCARFESCRVFAIRPPAATNWFVGATPECLVKREGQRVDVDALAGTAAPDVDEAVFLGSEKDRIEHQLVIDAIEQALVQVATLHIPTIPIVDRLANVAHLRTPIEAQLDDAQVDVLELARRLHPTPAVCGLPMAPAKAYIEAKEGLDRGWYTGAIGWMTLDGDGEWDVAIRCALLTEREAFVYVGAGIVEASNGAWEVEETKLKAQAILSALTRRVSVDGVPS